MRCYFLIDGCIHGAETLPLGLSDEDAIAMAHMLSSKRRGPYGGFEVWDRARFVFGYPPSAETPAPISRAGCRPPLMDDRTHRDTLGPNWPWPAAGPRH